jgi:orotidine-5'-phosphate decarboxylase
VPTRNFREILEAQWDLGKFVCVGLDSDIERIPRSVSWTNFGEKSTRWSIVDIILAFNKPIIEATKELVCAYKLNPMFYMAQGTEGIKALRLTIMEIHSVAPSVLVILDDKRGDILHTNIRYPAFAFDYLRADAITVNPYLGCEPIRPFLENTNKGVFVVCATSNPDASEFQNLDVRRTDGLSPSHPESYAWEPLYAYVARRFLEYSDGKNNCCFVVGATHPDKIRVVRNIVGDMPILVPGIGEQDGDLERIISRGKDNRGKGLIINSSRGIIFASSEHDFAEVAAHKTSELQRRVNQHLREGVAT